MFFRKKSAEPITNSGIKKLDAIITTVVLGGVIGSIYGIKKLKERQTPPDPYQTHIFEPASEKKRGLWSRIFGTK